MLTWRAARRVIGFVVCILCPALHAQTFATSLNYPVGSNPFGVAAADFNRDGKPDLVVVNQASNTISVLLNVANGTFGPATTYPTGPSPQFVAVGDFNNDGSPDVIVANTNSSTIGIFLGNGDGTLRPMVSIGVGFEPIALAVADFNSDGRLDIAVANFGSNTVSVLLGNGDGSFQVPTDYAVDINPRSIVAGDFNGDGKLDIAVSHGVFTISVLLNAGNGTFAPAVNSKFAFGGGAIAAADLNGDGRLDLVLANQGIGGFSVLLGAGDGTFLFLAQFSTFSGMFPNSIALADMNGDGRVDLIASDPNTGVNVFAGDGKGGFSAPARFFADVRPWYAITADFNADGRPDVAVVNTSSNDVSVLVNTTVPAAGSTTGWRMQGINPSRTNAATAKGPETLPGFKILAPNVNGALERIALDGSLILMQPLVANSSPSIGVVSSYSRAGKLQWTTNVPTDLFGLRDIAVSQFGTVYVTPSATLSNLIALDANSGQQLWTETNNTSNRSHPLAVGSDDTIYFTSGAGPLLGKISAVNPDGSLKWQIIGPESNIALSTDESSLYVLTTKGIAVPTGDVKRYSTVDGSFIANTPCDPRGDVYAFAPWNVLYTGNGNNDLLAFPPGIQSCPVISANGMVAVGIASTTTTGRIITINNDGTLGGLDQQGNLLWRSTEPLSQAFSSADAVIYAVAPVKNDLVALESEHGAVLWRQHFTDPITGQFLADDGNVYLTAGRNIFVSSPVPILGTITVSTNNANATFTVTDSALHTLSGSGTLLTQQAPPGLYTVEYGHVDGFLKPPTETKQLASGQTISFNGDYQPLLEVGLLTVTSNISTAMFSINPQIPGIGSGPYPVVTFIPTGTYTIAFNSLPGTVPPAPYTISIVAGGSVTVEGNYRVKQAPSLSVRPKSMSFTVTKGSPIVVGVIVGSDSQSVSYSIASSVMFGTNWLSATQLTTKTPSAVAVTLNSNLEVGTYSGQIAVISSEAANSPVVIPVKLTIVPEVAPSPNIQIICRPLEDPGDPYQLQSRIGRHCYFLANDPRPRANRFTTFGAYDINGLLTPAINGDIDHNTGQPKIPGGCGTDVLQSECVEVPLLKDQDFDSLVTSLRQAVDAGAEGAYDNAGNNSNLWVQQRINSLKLAANLPSDVITSNADVCRLFPLLINRLTEAPLPINPTGVVVDAVEVIIGFYGVKKCLL